MQAFIVYFKPKNLSVLEQMIEKKIISNFDKLNINYVIDGLHFGDLDFFEKHKPVNYLLTDYQGYIVNDFKQTIFMIVFNEKDNPTKEDYDQICLIIYSSHETINITIPEFLKRSVIPPSSQSNFLPESKIPNKDGVIVTYATKEQWKEYNEAWEKYIFEPRKIIDLPNKRINTFYSSGILIFSISAKINFFG